MVFLPTIWKKGVKDFEGSKVQRFISLLFFLIVAPREGFVKKKIELP